MSGPSATPNTYPYQNETIWSRSEKAIARKVFDAALKRELHEIIQETKQKANQIKEPAKVWELERYLTPTLAPNTLRNNFVALLGSPLLIWEAFKNGSLALNTVLRWYSYTDPWNAFVPLLVTRLMTPPIARP